MQRNKLVHIQKRNREPDSSGGWQTPSGESEWLTFARVWARVKVVQADEKFESDAPRQESTHLWNISYVRGLTSEMRIKWGIRTFDIVRMRNPGERNRELNLETEELTPKTQEQAP